MSAIKREGSGEESLIFSSTGGRGIRTRLKLKIADAGVLSERTAGNVDAAGAFSKTKIVKFSGEEIMLVEFQVGVFNLYVSAGDIGGGVWLIIEVNKQIALCPVGSLAILGKDLKATSGRVRIRALARRTLASIFSA